MNIEKRQVWLPGPGTHITIGMFVALYASLENFPAVHQYNAEAFAAAMMLLAAVVTMIMTRWTDRPPLSHVDTHNALHVSYNSIASTYNALDCKINPRPKPRPILPHPGEAERRPRAARCVHEWIDITSLDSPDLQVICGRCAARKPPDDD